MENVPEHLLHQSVIKSGERKVGRDRECDLTSRQFLFGIIHDSMNQIGKIYPIVCRLDHARFKAGHVEKIPNKTIQSVSGSADLATQFLTNLGVNRNV